MNLPDLMKENRSEILRIAALHGAHNIRVFGSVARGDAGPQSDIDLLVDFEPNKSLLDHAAMAVEIECLLGRAVDIVPEKNLKERIRSRILREALPL